MGLEPLEEQPGAVAAPTENFDVVAAPVAEPE